MLSDFFNFLLAITQGMGYLGVGLLMAIESSFIPMPSEIIVPPAAYLASQGVFNIWLVFLAGVLGSVAGAIFNYFIGFYLGRPLIYKLAAHRFAKFFLISPEKIKRAEKYFFDNAASATFIGRLIPVIRQLISIPAGFSKMPFLPFIFYTTIGSALWVGVLAALGYFIGAQQELLHTYYKEATWVFVGLAVFWLGFKIFQVVNKKNPV